MLHTFQDGRLIATNLDWMKNYFAVEEAMDLLAHLILEHSEKKEKKYIKYFDW